MVYPGGAADSEKPQILAVDDERAGVDLVARALRKVGKVQTATSAEEGWTLAQSTKFDLVISDQRMPGTTGVELLKRIAEQDHHTGRILLTGYADINATIDAINEGGVHAYVSKPCPPDQLRMAATTILERTALARRNAELTDELSFKNEELEAALRTVRALIERVVASERLSAIGEMIANVVHDFRGPLSVILSAGRELAREEALPFDEVRELAQQMVAEGDRMTRMCGDLLDVTHVTVGEASREQEDLASVMSASIGALVRDASVAGVQIETDFEEGIRLALDEDRFRRAILNLGYNAIDAMPDGGVLRFRTVRDAGRVIVSVSDTGEGVPDEVRDRLFEPFATFGKQGGTGLGLAIVRKVVSEHEGEIEVGKPDGGGTVFQLVFRSPERAYEAE